MPARTMTVKEAAEYIGCTPSCIYKMEARGLISRIENMPGVRFRRSDLEHFVGEDKNVAQFSPSLLLAENSLLKKENARLRDILQDIYTAASGAVISDYMRKTGSRREKKGETA